MIRSIRRAALRYWMQRVGRKRGKKIARAAAMRIEIKKVRQAKNKLKHAYHR